MLVLGDNAATIVAITMVAVANELINENDDGTYIPIIVNFTEMNRKQLDRTV